MVCMHNSPEHASCVQGLMPSLGILLVHASQQQLTPLNLCTAIITGDFDPIQCIMQPAAWHYDLTLLRLAGLW